MNMSNHVYCEQSETKPAADSGCEADGLETLIHTASIRVEYHRSFEYCLKWKKPMSSRRSSGPQKSSKKSLQGSPSSDEEVIQRRLRGKRRRTAPRKTEVADGVINADDGRELDIIDIINCTHGAKRVAEEGERKFVEVADKGVDGSDDDCVSVTSSIASGPSLLCNATPKKPRPTQGLCSRCRTLYQKAKKMKAPVKNKLFDNDPKSLTCDQWVLIKHWRPRRLPNARGKLLTHLQLVRKRLKVKNGAMQTEPWVGEGESAVCARPHTFLQRNLRRRVRVRVPVKKETKKNRRKRKRDDAQSSRVAKQQRLHSDGHRKRISISGADNDGLHAASGCSSSHGFEGCSDQEMDDLTIELIPSTVTLEVPNPREAAPKQKAPKKTRGFRKLLAQLRGNSSMIVRETR